MWQKYAFYSSMIANLSSQQRKCCTIIDDIRHLQPHSCNETRSEEALMQICWLASCYNLQIFADCLQQICCSHIATIPVPARMYLYFLPCAMLYASWQPGACHDSLNRSWIFVLLGLCMQQYVVQLPGHPYLRNAIRCRRGSRLRSRRAI